MKGAVCRSAEIGGQEHKRDDDERRDYCTAATNLLALHGKGASKVLP
jgi:hypothetical protein